MDSKEANVKTYYLQGCCCCFCVWVFVLFLFLFVCDLYVFLFVFWLVGVFLIYGYMVKDHSDSKRENPLLTLHGLLIPISSKAFICIG